MRDHELDLIAALAEGSLEDETEARALIESSDEARLEYEAQKQALAALGAMEPVAMSDVEKAALHRDVWTELTTTPRPSTKTPWYYRFAPVAASLFVVVGIGAVLIQNNDDAATETFQEIGSSLDGGGAGDTVTTLAAAGGVEDSFGESSAPTAIDEDLYAEHAAKLRDGAFVTLLGRGLEQDDAADLQACVDQNPTLDGYEVIGALPAPDEELTAETTASVIAARPADADLSTALIAFVDLETCELLYVEE